jgi:hypothetical protein
MQHNGRDAKLGEQERLFLSLVEQLSRPFLQIARLSELQTAASGTETQPEWRLVQAIAGSSLQLVESYALSLRVNGQVTPLELEPVTVSSLLYDTAQSLKPYAQHYAVELELEPGPKLQPILADRVVLQSAMTALGQVFVLSQAESEEPMPVRLAAHRSRYGVVAGLYGQAAGLGADSLRRAQQLHGTARQPLQRLVSGPAAGVFVADSLLKALSARLHVARYRNLTGLATTLQPSQQLQLI